MTIRELRLKLDSAARYAAAVDPDGNEIEHANHNILVAAHALGSALKAREEKPMSRRAMRALGHKGFR